MAATVVSNPSRRATKCPTHPQPLVILGYPGDGEYDGASDDDIQPQLARSREILRKR